MKAAVYNKKNRQNPIEYVEVADPEPKADELLVKIAASAIAGGDIGLMKLRAVPENKILGGEIAGVVEAVGAKVRRFSVGDRVCADTSSCGLNGFAEYAAIPERVAACIPPSLSFETAAALQISAVTAYQGLQLSTPRDAKTVLVWGAGGGVGTFAVQLAKAAGMTVTAVCGTGNVELIKTLGADVVVDYMKEDVRKTESRFDRILAVNGKNTLSTYKRMLNPEGVCVVIGGALSQILGGLIFGRLLSIGKRKILTLTARSNLDDVKYIMQLVEEGKITPVIDRRYPLEQANEAIKYCLQGHVGGKVVLTMRE